MLAERVVRILYLLSAAPDVFACFSVLCSSNFEVRLQGNVT